MRTPRRAERLQSSGTANRQRALEAKINLQTSSDEEENAHDNDAGKGEWHDKGYWKAFKEFEDELFAFLQGIGFNEFADACDYVNNEDDNPENKVDFEQDVVLLIIAETERAGKGVGGHGSECGRLFVSRVCHFSIFP